MEWIICLLFFASASIAANETVIGANTRLLNNILSYVDEGEDACNNYFQHACGKYAARHIDDPFTEITQMLDHKVNQNLLQLMDELERSSRMPGFNEGTVEAKALRFYLTCRDAPASTRNISHYLRLAPPADGLTWPQFSPRGTVWPKDQFKWMETLAHLHRYGLRNVLINVLIIPRLENREEIVVDISMPLFESQHLNGFTETVAMLRMMGVKPKGSITQAIKIRRLESAVKTLTEADEDPDIQLMTVHQLERRNGHVWRKFIETVVGHTIPNDLRVQFQNLDYFSALNRLMESSDAEVVVNYIMSRFVLHLLEDTMESAEPIQCIMDLRRNMNLATNLFYKERFLQPQALQRNTLEVEKIINQLSRQFLLQIERNRLGLTARQRRMVARKVQSISLNIGNLPKNLDHQSFVSQFYDELEISTGDLDYNREHLKLLRFRTRKEMAQLGHPAPSVGEYFYMAESNSAMNSGPMFMMRQNVIIVPHGILQEPFFLPDSHDVFKYSLLGFVLAHELMHAVDGTGILIDSHGNHFEMGGEILSSSRFEEGLECMNRNKTQYLDERVADISGLSLAYATYFDNVNNQSRLDFTNKSQEQLFFLNLAQFFCGDVAASNFVGHDNDEMRLQQLLNGFQPFDRAFGCRRDQTPVEKCQLW
ncbi:membrane metallo-endopeptidase-like 1 [Drosophila serrata]|uniref:membrane metallo-endopeptidase-like 1 n=1 Tax=Drosophila serrata TaxID=7274 RepID=UPI000A1D2309|nr:membrane metallo-endopeptidase-like 1 [Drosophila serrata]